MGVATAGLGAASVLTDADVEGAPQNVNKASMPSDLKITDLRVAVVTGAPMTCPIIRIDTNQGISGYGEVRDGASKTYALLLKSASSARTPATSTRSSARSSSSALRPGRREASAASRWPVGIWPERRSASPCTRCWADASGIACVSTPTPPSYPRGTPGEAVKERMDRGLTFLKVDVGIDLLEGKPDMVTRPTGAEVRGSSMVMHPFSGLSVTDKGIAYLRLRGGHPRGDRDGDPPRLRPLRPHRRQLLHPPRQGHGEEPPGLDGGPGAMAARRS